MNAAALPEDDVARALMAAMGQLPAALAARLIGDALKRDNLDLRQAGAALYTWLSGRAYDAATPIAELCPSIPGPLEQLTNALLADVEPAGARAILAELLAAVDRVYPNLVASARAHPQEMKKKMLEDQANAEVARAEVLLGEQKRGPACFAAARALLLVPNHERASSLLNTARGGAFRFSPPQNPRIAETELLLTQHPERKQLHRQLADMYRAEGYLPGVARHLKRALRDKPNDVGGRKELLELIGDVTPGWPFAAGSLSTFSWPNPAAEAAAKAAAEAAAQAAQAAQAAAAASAAQALVDAVSPGATHAQEPAVVVGAAPEEPAGGPVQQLLRSLSTMYGSLEPRSRLFLMVLTFGALTGGAVLVAFSSATSPATEKRVQLERLAQEAADCGPGGGTLLVAAWQASRYGATARAEELLDDTDASVPLGTRCQRHAMILVGRSDMEQRERGRK